MPSSPPALTAGSAVRRLVALLTVLAASAAPAPAVVGPNVDGAAFADSVAMVLSRTARKAGFCSGIVIGPRVLITAAHCAAAAADLRVLLPGAAGAERLLPVDAVAVHPGYRPDAAVSRQVSIDLALIHVGARLPAPVRPLPLARAGGAAVGTPVRLVGFGVTREDDPQSAGRLRLGRAAVRAPLSHVLLWAAAADGTGACMGDSGGGIFGGGGSELLAVIAWAEGAGSSHCGVLTQATWVAPHRAWIETVQRDWATRLGD